MRRSVERKRNLPAFRLDVAEFGLLWEKCLALFDPAERAVGRLYVDTSGAELRFDSFDEFRNCTELEPNLKKFRLSFESANFDRRLTIRGAYIGNRAVVTTTGPDEAWCAGAVETAVSFTQRHRVWHWWLSSAPLFSLSLVVAAVTPWALSFAGIKSTDRYDLAVTVPWGAVVLTLGVLSAMQKTSFPGVRIVVRERQGFIRQYVGELGLVIAVLSLVAAVVSIVIAWPSTGHG